MPQILNRIWTWQPNRIWHLRTFWRIMDIQRTVLKHKSLKGCIQLCLSQWREKRPWSTSKQWRRVKQWRWVDFKTKMVAFEPRAIILCRFCRTKPWDTVGSSTRPGADGTTTRDSIMNKCERQILRVAWTSRSSYLHPPRLSNPCQQRSFYRLHHDKWTLSSTTCLQNGIHAVNALDASTPWRRFTWWHDPLPFTHLTTFTHLLNTPPSVWQR